MSFAVMWRSPPRRASHPPSRSKPAPSATVSTRDDRVGRSIPRGYHRGLLRQPDKQPRRRGEGGGGSAWWVSPVLIGLTQQRLCGRGRWTFHRTSLPRGFCSSLTLQFSPFNARDTNPVPPPPDPQRTHRRYAVYRVALVSGMLWISAPSGVGLAIPLIRSPVANTEHESKHRNDEQPQGEVEDHDATLAEPSLNDVRKKILHPTSLLRLAGLRKRPCCVNPISSPACIATPPLLVQQVLRTITVQHPFSRFSQRTRPRLIYQVWPPPMEKVFAGCVSGWWIVLGI